MCKIIILVAFLALGACSSVPHGTIETFASRNHQTDSIERLSFVTYNTSSFKKLLERHSEIQLVDVRSLKEYEAGHIENAMNIDVRKDDFIERALKSLDPKYPVAVYCKGGVRSRKAAKALTSRGFVVYNLDKGYDDWIK